MNLDQNTLRILSGLEHVDAHHIRIAEQLDRGTYTKVNKVLEALGGKWNKKAKAHFFGSDAQVRIDHAIVTGEVTTGQDVGWFPTPAPLAKEFVRMAGVKPGDYVLEPSAGEGAIVLAIQDAGGIVTAVEHDPSRSIYLLERVLKGRDFLATSRDFLYYLPGRDEYTGDLNLFDRVVMNPPFCKVGKGDHLDHVRHAHSLLKPASPGRTGGVLVSVLPSSVTFRQDRRYREFRDWVSDLGGTITPLPEGSFKASGTGVNTCVVRIGAEEGGS